MIKKTLIIGILVGNLVLLLTHLFVRYLPESGPLSVFSKLYHLSRLIGGSIWNHWIIEKFQISAVFMTAYEISYYVIIYSIIYGVLGVISGVIENLLIRK